LLSKPKSEVIVATNELNLDVLLDELIDTHGTPVHTDGINLGQDPTQDKLTLEDIECAIASTEEQVCAEGNQICLRGDMRTMQDSQSDTQSITIPDDTNFPPQNGGQTHQEILNVVYDENTVPIWSSDYEDEEIKFVKTGIQPVFTQCFAAGFKLSTDPPAPHKEDLTIATLDTGIETDHSERRTNLIGTRRTQVKTQVNQAFAAGVKYRDAITHYCAIEDEVPPLPTVPFPDLLGDLVHA
jgi:hypothetical protein